MNVIAPRKVTVAADVTGAALGIGKHVKIDGGVAQVVEITAVDVPGENSEFPHSTSLSFPRRRESIGQRSSAHRPTMPCTFVDLTIQFFAATGNARRADSRLRGNDGGRGIGAPPSQQLLRLSHYVIVRNTIHTHMSDRAGHVLARSTIDVAKHTPMALAVERRPTLG